MLSVSFEVWLGEILLGKIENPSGNQFDTRFVPSIQGPSVSIMANNRYDSWRDCFAGVIKLVPAAARELVFLLRYEGGKLVGKEHLVNGTLVGIEHTVQYRHNSVADYLDAMDR